MRFFDLANHLFNFVLPAIAMGVMMPFFSRMLWRQTPAKRSLMSQMLITSSVCLTVLFAGLVVFNTDGKMMTYIGVVLAAAGCQWWYLGGWRVK